MLTYTDNHNLQVRRAWSIGKHDEESNSVRWSSTGQKITIAMDFYAMSGTWPKTIAELKNRSMFSGSKVRRWVRAAQGMVSDVIA